MADGTIKIDVQLNEAPAQAQAQAVGQKLGQQVSSAVESASADAKKSTQQAMNEIGGTLTSFGAKYSKAVTLPIAAAAVATGASAVKIDTALTGVRKTVDGTEEQYEALKDAAIEFSKTNAVDPAQILDIQALGAQLGYTIDELDMFGEVVSGLDIATNLSAEEAATELAQFANIMGMSHDKTKNFGSTIVELGNNFATTEADISHMAMRIAGAGKQIGLTEADVLGLATALSSMGINAEAGGTAISTIMANIDKEVATNGKNLETWAQTANMSVDEFVNAWGTDAVGALSAVLIGMDSATEAGGNMSVMLDELGITSIRQTDTFKRLASNSEFLGRAVKTANNAWEENVALDKEVENRNNSMAAQLQILWNKIQAVAVEVGEPLMKALIGIIDAAEPLIDALASGAKAFADLDEEGQRTVLMAIAIVAAIGPVSGVLGKVITGVNGSTASWKKFAENLKTVKTNLIVSTAEINKQAAAQSKYKTIMIGGQKATVKYNAATKEMKVVQSATTNATKAQAAAMTASATATKASVVAMNTAKAAAGALKAAFLTIAPVIAITAAVEAFTMLSGAISKANERAESFNKATEVIRDSGNAYQEAYAKASASMNDAAKSAENYSDRLQYSAAKADEVIQKQAELADSLSETWSEAGTNAAMVDTYAETIDKLTHKYDENGTAVTLTAEEQAELYAAVDGLNSIMGTSYSVIDAQNGILNTNTDEILNNADAWNKRALAEAASAANTELMKQKIETHGELAKATEELERATRSMNETNDPEVWKAANEQAKYYGEEVARLEEAEKAIDDQIATNNQTVKDMTQAYNSSAAALKEYIQGTDKWGSALQDAEVDADSFIKSLSDIGVSTEDLARIMAESGDEGIQGFISAYKEGGDALETYIRDEMGINLSDAARTASSKVGDGFIDGLSGEELRIVNAVAGVVGVSNAEFAKVAEGAGVSGQQAISAFALAFAEGTITAESSADEVRAAVDAKLAEMDGEVPASQVIDDITKTFDAGQSSTSEAAAGVKTAGQTELDKLDGETPASTEMGNWLQAIRNAKEATGVAANQDADAAKEGLRRDIGKASSWGDELGTNFASGVNSIGAISAASDAAHSLANTVKNILGHSVPKDGPLREGGKGEAIWGEHLVQNIIDGMMKKRPELRTATKELAQDMNDELMAELMDVDPMKQLTESISRGSAAVNMSAMMVGAAPSYTNNTQNVNFNGPTNSPDIIAMQLRMQNRYGLAGKWL